MKSLLIFDRCCCKMYLSIIDILRGFAVLVAYANLNAFVWGGMMKHIGTVFAYTVIAALLAVLVLAQITLVWAADEITRLDFPELRYLWVPYASAAVVAVAFLQVALACIFVLVHRARSGKIYQPGTLKFIDAATMAFACAGLIPIVVIQHLNWAENANPPLLMLVFLILLVLTPATVGLARVARRVYLRARAEHEELEGVI